MRRLFLAALSTILAAGVLTAGPPATAAPPPAPTADEASNFTSLQPVRLLDTRVANNPVGPGTTIALTMASHVPVDATAVVLNVTGVAPTAGTFVTVFPSGVARPNASNLNLVPGETRANQVTVALGSDAKVSLYNNAGTTHLVADLAGYYRPGTGAKFTALPASRLTDTRWGGGAPLGPGETRVVDLNDRVPTSATAVTFNLTATGVTAATFVTAWPTGTARPNASNVNLTAGETRPNLVTVALSATRTVSLYNNAGNAHLIVDLTGFYTPEFGASFIPRAPQRVLDTRNGTGTGGATTPVGAGQGIDVSLSGTLPLTTTGLVVNLTGVDATAATYVTAYGPFRPVPNASTLNLVPGQTAPNAAVVALAQLPFLSLYNNAGSVHLIADLAGVFAVTGAACTDDCVYTWGDNGEDRKLGTAEVVQRTGTPKPVVTLSGVREVSSGGFYNGYALKNDGTVWSWGNNAGGQLGNGWTTNGDTYSGGSPVPVRAVGLTGVTAIAGSDRGAYALRSDGTVWGWGDGLQGRLGRDHLAGSSVPVRIEGLTDIVAIASNQATGFALRSDGAVWVWGSNGWGELGNGTEVEALPVPVRASIDGVTTIASGGNNVYAVRNDGTLWAWGANYSGQLGNGAGCDPTTICESRVPVQVSGLTGVTDMAAGFDAAYAVRSDGTVWSWGTSELGKLGNGAECAPPTAPCESRVPVRVSGITDAVAVASFDYGGYALRANGTLMSWGDNTYQALGNDQVFGHTTVPVSVNGVSGVSAIDGRFDAGFALVP